MTNTSKCPKCGGNNISFTRELIGEHGSGKNSGLIHRKDRNHSEIIYRTVGLCNDCGYTWELKSDVNEATIYKKKQNTWLWIIGWICFFPIPLTILILNSEKLEQKVKYGLIAIMWALLLAIGFLPDTGQDNVNIADEGNGIVSEESYDEGFILTYDDLDEIGTIESIGSEDLKKVYKAFYLPAGNYSVTNIGDYSTQLSVAHKGTYFEDGYEYQNVAKQRPLVLSVDETAEISLEKDDYIYIIEGSKDRLRVCRITK